VGQRNGLQLEVMEGLQSGDLVITHPDNRLADGVRVTTEPVGVF
jgi:multidrug efflux pump subunit AcrA (membrane-fusion protein)